MTRRAQPRVGVIGGGFGALSVAGELLRHGYDDVRVWEKSEALGGVWRDNTYPGAGCDVPSPLYSLSWAPTTRWSRRYGLQLEILDYIRDVADEVGVTERVRLNAEVVSATWNAEARHWTVSFADGTTEDVDVLVPAVGQLSRPKLPDLEGMADFAGPSFHSARWDHEADLSGRVAVVGTGASAIQFVPHLVAGARQVTVFQRTPNWIVPKFDGPFARWYRPAIRAERPFWWTVAEQFARGLDLDTSAAKGNAALAGLLLRRQVADPVLREKLTPTYPIGCKRILFSNEYYPAISQPNVELVTDRVERVTERGIVHGGREREFDAIVYGTGFDSQDFLDSIEIRGRDGRLLSEQWQGGARAYLGIYVPGFPNLLISYGPNTNLGGGSIIYMLEAQARHMRQVLDRLGSTQTTTVEVTEPAEQRWDSAVQHRLEKSAWASCDNWYTDPTTGRITSNWPGATHPYAKATATLDAEAFAWR